MTPSIPAALRRRRIALLQGGRSAERPISLKSGRAVSAALRRLGLPHQSLDIVSNLPTALRRHKIDLAFLVTHGPFGEDGRLQGLLDLLNIPYTGSGVLASALAMHKPSAKALFQNAGLPTAPWCLRRRGEPADRPPFPGPWVVKPASQGSAVGVRVVRRAGEWAPALRKSWAVEPEALVERYLRGPEYTVGVLDDHPLPVVQIIPKHAFYDFYSKYAVGGSRHVVPAPLPPRRVDRLQRLAVAAHRALGCRHVSRVDLIWSDRPYLLEVNTLPGMTDTSLLPDAARAAGLSFDDLVLRLLTLALRDAAAA